MSVISLTVIILDMNTKTTHHAAAMLAGCMWSGRISSSCTMLAVIWYIALNINISLSLHGGSNDNPSSILICVMWQLTEGQIVRGYPSIRSCLCLKIVEYWFLFWFKLCRWHGYNCSITYPHTKCLKELALVLLSFGLTDYFSYILYLDKLIYWHPVLARPIVLIDKPAYCMSMPIWNMLQG